MSQNANSTSKPYAKVFTVIERPDSTWWHEIGAAWLNKDDSLSVVLNSLPLDGRLQIKRPTEKATKETQGEGNQPPPSSPKGADGFKYPSGE